MNPAKIFDQPMREYVIIVAVFIALTFNFFVPGTQMFLIIAAAIGGIPTAVAGLRGFLKLSITIEAFNLVALVISFMTGEYQSAAFIVLMLSFASLLEWRTQSRTRNAVAELLALKPRTATVEHDGATSEVEADTLKEGDIFILMAGARVPADGVIVQGSVFVNEASVTGESVPIVKDIGESVLSGTLGDSGAAKVRVTHIGKESTLERMAVLIEEALKHKSKTERLADRFATIFLPVVLLLGAGTYYFTHNLMMVASIFLVACADDMAVAIPLAVSAAIGSAAKRGVVVKGGEWLDALSRVKTVVLDKTGTLTYGSFNVSTVAIEPGVNEKEFWTLVASAERYSEHPVARAIFKEAKEWVEKVPDYSELKTIKGCGVTAKVHGHDVAVGDEGILELSKVVNEDRARTALDVLAKKAETAAIVVIDGKFAGSFGISDMPKPEARLSIDALRQAGVAHVVMFTGDNTAVANAMADAMGITEVSSAMSPADKLNKLESLPGPVAMVGDGINDAPALARSDVGIAMGIGGTAVSVEAADIVVMTDNLSRISEMIALGRRTRSVVHWDVIIWAVTNVIGFVLVFTGVLGPALAAFYNFITDFLPLINSARLFREKSNV
ncbi:MAG: cation-translocating P-type ATPase [Candidatus Paceibacterota bacterium]|jgi:heavy metal translocating P-type ATPase